MTDLTPEEEKLIEIVRAIEMEFGRIVLTIYVQHGKLIRVETEKAIESKVITAGGMNEATG